MTAINCDDMVGGSTDAPMVDHAEDFGAAFTVEYPNLEQIFYCAESVLLPSYRGPGVGHRFFDAREGCGRKAAARMFHRGQSLVFLPIKRAPVI